MKSKYRYLIYALVFLAGVMFAFTATGADKKPHIAFDKETHDFGKIREKGGKVTCEFTFSNAGAGNLVITDATAQCGCTKPTYPENPIAAGKTGVIKVTYNPMGRPGLFEKTVTVKTNGHPKKVRLKIKGEVIQ